MSSINIEDLTAALESTRVSPKGVSFAGKSLKLNTKEDAKEVCEEIDNCPELQYLNMEGNTLGVEASKEISKALEKHPEFKRALWKDMFTGRMKTEIPKALEYLGQGLVIAGARLTELDLSDNAFGPIGVDGLAALLRSSSCYALEELRLNNNGLGITGGKLLATALTDCYNYSKKEGKALALKVFIAGRNRLENEGAIALSAVFKMIGTLEEIAMPQNGIYHVGISALSQAFVHNKNLRILNLNDNTIGKKGAAAIAKALPSLQNLKQINFGDCLLKTKGAILLAAPLKEGHNSLEELILDHNEIRTEGAITVVRTLINKTNLKSLNLNANQFGDDGMNAIRDALKEIGKLNTLDSLSEDESNDSEEEDDDDDEEEEEEDQKNDDSEKATIEESKGGVTIMEVKTVEDFLTVSTAENFMLLGDARSELLLRAAKGNEISLETFIPVLMKVSSLSQDSKDEIASKSLQCAEQLYKELFTWSEKSNSTSLVNNAILVNLTLIKSEDKKFKPNWNVESGRYALKQIVDKPFVPEVSRGVLKFFLENAKSVRTL